MVYGMAKKCVVRLEPNRSVKQPSKNTPHKAPMQLVEPIHDNWSLVIGPDTNGVSFDAKFGNVQLTQPICNPCVNAIKFATNQIKTERKIEN